MCSECNWPIEDLENRLYKDENGEINIAWPRKWIIKEEAMKMLPDNDEKKDEE